MEWAYAREVSTPLWIVAILSCGGSAQGLSFALVSELNEHPTRIYAPLCSSTLAATPHAAALLGYPRSTTLTTGAGNLSGNLGVGGSDGGRRSRAAVLVKG